ncbi:MAG TPA: hypothetical protein VES39_06865, partial [Rhodospirillales bacterium]|nr:hypothetical protein [Rhodospirillales bacterium]
MSGFSADWLALRASADRRARAPSLLAVVRRRFRLRGERRTPLRVADLGAGTGSTLQLLAPLLPAAQHWTLLDDDAALLAAVVRPPTPRPIMVRPVRVDLADARVLEALLRGAELITASALLDLVSPRWCRRLIAAAARPDVVLYAALTYDGRMALDPADPLDDTVHALFDRHQRRDKGF